MNEKDVEKLVFGMAHQIRNPCAIILSNANLLIQNQPLNPEMKRSLEAIVNGAKYLEARLDEFVEFSKPLFLKSEKVPVEPLLNDIVALVRDKCKLQKTQLSCSVEQGLVLRSADRRQLLLALLNVILNGIESIKEGGEVALSAQGAHEIIVIKVQDNGCGIHPRDLPEIFSPFYSTKKSGIGIGLAVTKRILDAHKGKIEVSSQQGSGTLVTVQIPNG